MRIIFLLILFLISTLVSQDDLLDLLDDKNDQSVLVEYAFKGTRVVNAHSLEIPRPKILQFMIQHRFGSIQNGFYDLFGTDNASIRYDFHYGISEFYSVGVGRSSLSKIYDIFSKTKVIRQKSGSASFPFSLVLYNNIGVNTQRKSENDPAVKNDFSNRLIFVNQVIIGRKFSRNLSLEILPSMIHKNLVKTKDDKHDLQSMGFAGRYKISKRISINADYFLPLGERGEDYANSFGIGIDYETGGHIFQVMITNSEGPYELTYIENSRGAFSPKFLHIGFNISRAFSLAGENKKNW